MEKWVFRMRLPNSMQGLVLRVISPDPVWLGMLGKKV